jgi:hypothetical protein
MSLPAAPTATRTPRTRILLNLLSASAGQWVAGRDIEDLVGSQAAIYVREFQAQRVSISERVERHNGQVLFWYRLNRDARW